MSLHSKELNITDNTTVYKRLHRFAFSKAEGKCDLCPPHAKENARKKRKPARSWKFKNKTRHQHS
jgi:hypothetical protein